MTPRSIRNCLLVCFAAIAAAMLPGCGWNGQFTVLGYTTQPNYDQSIRTVYVPIFGNQTFYRGWEFELTRAVIREIESKTPYKVASSPDGADSELIGNITRITKTLINANQLNEVREAQTILSAEIVWRDLRPGQQGQLLSSTRQGGAQRLPGPVDPTAPPPPPTLITAIGHFVPELGGSITSVQKQCVDRLAVQVISMMEIWPDQAVVPASEPRAP